MSIQDVLLNLVSRAGLLLGVLTFIPTIVFAAEMLKTEISIVDRHKTLEGIAMQVSRDAELTLHLYQMAMNMAIEEAKVELQTLRGTQYVQQCSIGVDRINTCLFAWRDATKILDAAFVRRNVSGTTNEFRMRLMLIAEHANRGGSFAPLSTVELNVDVVSYVMENRRLRKSADLQRSILRTVTGLGNALINNSSILISTRAILEPMRVMAERPASERVDVIWILTNALESAQNELNRAKIDPNREGKPFSLHKVLPLRITGQSGF